MRISDAVTVVTGAGGGIGAALARRFAALGARTVIVADRDAATARAVAAEINGVPETLDVADGQAVRAVVDRAIDRFGRIDLYCANAGITAEQGLGATDAIWRRAFDVNVMAHVHAAQAVIPHMVAQGQGHFVATASAAGLLSAPADAPYTASKHAAVGFAEWLAISYGPSGVGVSVLCPMGVATPMLMKPLAEGVASARAVAASGAILSPEQVAEAVSAAVEDGRFLIVPHPEVATFWAKKAANPERWIAAMQRLVANPPSHREVEA
ncbi:MAG TPA: SDR family NAD(P)-dependent oxidoreductase [Pseudonocardiaceae bacterium]|nr:SDR family NAD(P)-dependent oxidoreductase [Pseudonocardiaceae bacterium]